MNLEGALTIYRIDYDAWVANGVNLVWSGSEALHTFVALDCDFAVAVHHKDVVRYEEVPAQGNVVLSKEILSGLSQYVDADINYRTVQTFGRTFDKIQKSGGKEKADYCD
jgi:hypothetical protein